MSSERQIKANRRNARKSTGPRTAEGKSIVAKNAVRHSLLSNDILVRDEDPAEFDGFAERLLAELAPVGEFEQLLADRIVVNIWRLNRLTRIEAAVLNEDSDPTFRVLADTLCVKTQQKIMVLSRYETALERSVNVAMRELERLQAARAQTLTAMPLPEADIGEADDTGEVEDGNVVG
jgi:hypothetical protein